MDTSTGFVELKKRLRKEVSQGESWTSTIKVTLGAIDDLILNISIHRVPTRLRSLNIDAYSPRIVAIGPLHKPIANLVTMEEHKWRYMLCIIHRTISATDSVDLKRKRAIESVDLCGKAISDLNSIVRESYAERVEPEDADLNEMMLVDGCFILEVLIRSFFGDAPDNDPIFKTGWMISTLKHDLTLLENQIPFVVLEKLFAVLQPRCMKQVGCGLKDLVLLFFHPNPKRNPESMEEKCSHLLEHLLNFYHPKTCSSPSGKEKKERTLLKSLFTGKNRFLPFLSLIMRSNQNNRKQDAIILITNSHTPKESKNEIKVSIFYRIFFWIFSTCRSAFFWIFSTCRSAKPNTDLKEPWGLKYSATKFSELGISIRKCQDNEKLTDITFNMHEGVIKIPQIQITETTDSLFRNLIAYEQCSLQSAHQCSNKSPHECNLNSAHRFTSYAILMKSLLRAPKDVDLLRHEEIITGDLVDAQDVLALFNGVSKEVLPKDFSFGKLCRDVNGCKTSSWNFYRLKAFFCFRAKRNLSVLKRDYCPNLWRIIQILAAVILLVLTLIQTIYSVKSFNSGNSG